MLIRYFVRLQGCPSTCIVPLPVYSSVIIRSCSELLRSMPVYQAQMKRTAFRSFAPAAGVYTGASPPRPPPWAGAAAGACAKAEDSVLIVSATAIATLIPKIFRRTVISSPFLLRVVRVTGGNLDHAEVSQP